jgi:hypothetical protein
MSPAEAKTRFRKAVAEHGAVRWIQDHPWTSVSIALGAGVVLGHSSRIRRALASTIAWLATSNFLTTAMQAAVASQKNHHESGEKPAPGHNGHDEAARAPDGREAEAAFER